MKNLKLSLLFASVILMFQFSFAQTQKTASSSNFSPEAILTPVNTPDYPLCTELDIDQFNPSVFIDPSNPDEILNGNVKYDHWIQGSIVMFELTNGQAIHSVDGGVSWNSTSLGERASYNGFPTAQISPDGRYCIGYTVNNVGQMFEWSDDHGANWNEVLLKDWPQNPAKYLWQNYLWIDNSERSMYSGNMYAAWRYVGLEVSQYSIEFCRSANGGENWGTAEVISSLEQYGTRFEEGPVIQTGPGGQVYVCWASHYNSPGSGEKALGFIRSFDGGQTFDINWEIIENIKGTTGYITAKNIDLNSFPSMAVDISGGPYDGRIYIVWANIGEPGINSGSDIDVYMITSDDDGSSWSNPIRVNQDPSGVGKEHLFPAITCDPETGTVSVIYYDDRNVASNMAEVYCSISYNGGESWEDFEISDVILNFDDLVSPGGMFSERIGINAVGGKVFPVWTDFRENFCRTITSPFVEKPFPKPENLIAQIIDWDNGHVLLTWNLENPIGLQHFNIYRDNSLIATTSDYELDDFLPDFGNYTYRVTAQFADGESSPQTAFLQWGIPEITLNNYEYNVELKPGDETLYILNIDNDGETTLEYNVSVNHDPTAQTSEDGGPDDFGYYWKDNNDPGGPVFDYIDISTTGSEITGITNDNYVGPFSVGFSFPFYDNYYDEFYVSSNGLITFGGSFSNPVNSPIPIADGNNNFIAWCWDDLQQKTGGQVFYQQFDEYTVIQFKDYAQNGTFTIRYVINAEIIIYKNGDILIQYLDHTPILFITNSCTVGIENENGSDGLQVAYNENYIENDLAVKFFNPGVKWLVTEFAYGSIEPGEDEIVFLEFNTDGYSIGDYYATLNIQTNDPVHQEVIIPVELIIKNDVPAIPQNLQHEVAGNDVTLTWDAPSGKSLTGYNIYESGLKINETTVTQTTFEITNLDPGLYLYQVTAVYSQGESNPNGYPEYVNITTNLEQIIDISLGWSGISSYVNPLNPDVESLFQPVIDDLVILVGEDGFYWPGQNINTLTDWNNEQGYKIKLTQERNLTFTGDALISTIITVPENWSMLPVLCQCSVSISDIFMNVGDDLVIVKEIAGMQVYWPSMGIFSLQNLQPGNAYYVNLLNPATISFTGFTKNQIIENKQSYKVTIPWNEPVRTGSTHTIAILSEVAVNLMAGDIIGVFDQTGVCVGLATYDGENSVALTAFGDDFTTEENDGLVTDEIMQFRLYRPSEDKEYFLDVEFSAVLPNQGSYVENGLSCFQSINYSSLGVTDNNGFELFTVYPNPSGGLFYIKINDGEEGSEFSITNSQGQIIRNGILNSCSESQTMLDMTEQPAGLYFITIKNTKTIQQQKLLISK